MSGDSLLFFKSRIVDMKSVFYRSDFDRKVLALRNVCLL